MVLAFAYHCVGVLESSTRWRRPVVSSETMRAQCKKCLAYVEVKGADMPCPNCKSEGTLVTGRLIPRVTYPKK